MKWIRTKENVLVNLQCFEKIHVKRSSPHWILRVENSHACYTIEIFDTEEEATDRLDNIEKFLDSHGCIL